MGVKIFPRRNDSGFQLVWIVRKPWDHYVFAGRHHLSVGPFLIRWGGKS